MENVKERLGRELREGLQRDPKDYFGLFQDPEFHRLVSGLQRICKQKDNPDPEYRQWLVDTLEGTIKRIGYRSYLCVPNVDESTEIVGLEKRFHEEVRADFNPFSGFLCHLANLDPWRYGRSVDYLLDPGGP